MNSKIVFLQVIITVVAITGQIHFPQNEDSNRPSLMFTSINSISTNEQYFDTIMAHSVTKLALDINRVVSTTSPDLANADSFVCGPVTLTGVLSLILLASIGRTFDEVSNLMGLDSLLKLQNDPLGIHKQFGRFSKRLIGKSGLEVGHLISYANGIFVQQGFPLRVAYQQASKAIYRSDIANLNFRENPVMAQNVINTWVSIRTNSKIPTLFDHIPPPTTKAIMVSVLYFKAAWEYPFFDGQTQLRPFFSNGRKSPSDRKVLMMSNGGEFPYYKDTKLGVEIIGFPYKSKRSTMYVILPRESNLERLKQVENLLTPNDIENLVNSTRKVEAIVLFPKMRLETNLDLKPTLQRLGVTSLFNPNQANLALLSSAFEQRFKGQDSPIASASSTTSAIPTKNLEDGLIFTRFGSQANCTPIYDALTNTAGCQNQLSNRAGDSTGTESIGPLEKLQTIRQQLSSDPNPANPGVYVDQFIHKVFIDITESGTEAAAVAGAGLSKSGGIVTFRCDIPFLFFIYHEDTKIVLFWGSVKSPPRVSNPGS